MYIYIDKTYICMIAERVSLPVPGGYLQTTQHTCRDEEGELSSLLMCHLILRSSASTKQGLGGIGRETGLGSIVLVPGMERIDISYNKCQNLVVVDRHHRATPGYIGSCKLCSSSRGSRHRTDATRKP